MDRVGVLRLKFGWSANPWRVSFVSYAAHSHRPSARSGEHCESITMLTP